MISKLLHVFTTLWARHSWTTWNGVDRGLETEVSFIIAFCLQSLLMLTNVLLLLQFNVVSCLFMFCYVLVSSCVASFHVQFMFCRCFHDAFMIFLGSSTSNGAAWYIMARQANEHCTFV